MTTQPDELYDSPTSADVDVDEDYDLEDDGGIYDDEGDYDESEEGGEDGGEDGEFADGESGLGLDDAAAEGGDAKDAGQAGSRSTPRVPSLQNAAELGDYLKREMASLDPDRMAEAVQTLVDAKTSAVLNNILELQAAMEPDPDEALAKRLVTQALTMNPEVARDRHLLTRARMVAAITNAEDPLQALAALQRKLGRAGRTAGGRGAGMRPEARTPVASAGTGAGKPGRPRSAERALAAKLGLPEDYIKRLNLKG